MTDGQPTVCIPSRSHKTPGVAPDDDQPSDPPPRLQVAVQDRFGALGFIASDHWADTPSSNASASICAASGARSIRVCPVDQGMRREAHR
jgi:hypothetical protein